MINTSALPVIDLTLGSTIVHAGREFVVARHVDLDLLLCKEVSSGQKVFLRVGQLDAPIRADPIRMDGLVERDLLAISQDQWDAAEAKREAVKPILNRKNEHGSAYYKELASSQGVSVPTLYRWASDYRNSGYLLTSLVVAKRDGGRGQGRLSEEVEAIITDFLKVEWLTLQKRSIKDAVTKIRERCHTAKLPLPAPNTIRLRIAWLDRREIVEKREGKAKAEDILDASKGSIPDANWPLQLIQIDHTLLPVIIVDDKFRKSIRRVWITLAIDVFSRICLGVHLSLDAPSANSVGQCLTHALLLKDKWLNNLQLPENVKWPFWGTPETVHADNAKEFRGKVLRHICSEYDIDLQWRPVKKPRYGAHIERLMGTVSTWLKTAPGATFSGPEEKGEYDAEGNACMTFDELEQWLVTRFARYHLAEVHTGIGTTPAQKWKEGLFGTKTTAPRGLPLVRTDEDKVRFDFLPFIERTVQNDGVVIDNIKYFDDVLRPWIAMKDPEHPSEAMSHRFRRDPRDISFLLFWEPRQNKIFEIRSRLASVSIWEWHRAQRQAAEAGVPKTDELAVFAFVSQNREIEEKAAEKSKAARRLSQRRRQHKKSTQEKIATANPRRKQYSEHLEGYDPATIAPIPEE